MDPVTLINKYGFPIVSAAGCGFMIYYVWNWVTKDIKPVLSEASLILVGLIDRMRMLDNDLVRLNQKLNTVLQLRKMDYDALRKTPEFDALRKTAHEYILKEEGKQSKVDN